MLENLQTVPENLKKQSFLARTKESIRNGEPLTIRRLPYNGDLLLANFAYKTVLKKFCEREDIPPTSLVLDYDTDRGSSWGKYWSDQVFEYVERPADPANPGHFVKNIMLRLAELFDLTLTNEELTAVPVPEKMNAGPLQNFDQDTFLKKVAEIKQLQTPRRKRVVIVQSGSMNVKRLSDQDVLTIAHELSATGLPLDVWVVTDRKFSTKGESSSLNSPDIQVEVESTDITILAASLAGDYLITTDSYYNHLGFGAQALAELAAGQPPVVRGAVLYTVFEPERWETKGASICESQALRPVLKKLQDLPKKADPVSVAQDLSYLYNQFFHHQDLWQGEVDPQDVQALAKRAIQDLSLLVKQN